jgi:hypothetical protein
MSAHTPGPWKFQANGTDTAFLIEGDGLLVASMSWHSSFRERFPLRKESQANARLIAAAPELLAELCKAADTFADTARYFSLLGKSDGAEVFRIAETAARSLIAKATGAA